MCSGPGFIGYALLSSGLCETLTFSDINRKAIAVAKITAREAGLLDRVTFYVSDCWDSIPESEVWDLVVVNPPYFNFNRKPVTQTDYFLPDGYVPLVWLDRDWRMHRKFYEGVGRHLTSGGKIVISECPEAGTLDEDWGEMIAKAGLRVIDTFLDAEYPTSFYYLILEKE
jgi:methylase of polypeptide subunit release factors